MGFGSVQKIIGVTDLQRHFRNVLDDVVKGRHPYVLTRGSRPEAVLISYEDFARMEQLQENNVLARFERLREKMATHNADFSDEEVQQDAAEARRQRHR